MALFLVESQIHNQTVQDIEVALEQVATGLAAVGVELIEAQVGQNLERLLLILDAPNPEVIQTPLATSPFTPQLLKEVRLVGQDLATVKAKKQQANYLVEWNLPAGLAMEVYLQRKQDKTPLYAQVPDVKFERTYVCEDMSKCLCFYDSPDEATVKRAREVVSAPIDALTPIRNLR